MRGTVGIGRKEYHTWLRKSKLLMSNMQRSLHIVKGQSAKMQYTQTLRKEKDRAYGK
jgi:hypothetical protein